MLDEPDVGALVDVTGLVFDTIDSSVHNSSSIAGQSPALQCYTMIVDHAPSEVIGKGDRHVTVMMFIGVDRQFVAANGAVGCVAAFVADGSLCRWTYLNKKWKNLRVLSHADER